MPNSPILKFTPEAKADLFDIFEYLSKNLCEPITASNLIDRIEKQCNLLASFPLLGSIPRDETLAKRGYRMKVVDNFLVFYMVDEYHVKVMRVINERRNYKNLL